MDANIAEAPAEPRRGPEVSAWLKRLEGELDEPRLDVLRRACELAERAHEGQRRASGEPYIAHPLAVAELLHDLNLDHETLAAAILHDVVEDTAVTVAELETSFGGPIAQLVDGVTKMDVIDEFQSDEGRDRSYHRSQVDALRRLLLAVVGDVRVVLVKLADRLHNMRTLGHLPGEKQRRIAKETLDIYAPLASRLGIWQFKWEMEDLALRYLEPDTYRRLASQLRERRSDREAYIAAVVQTLTRELAAAGIAATVSGRPKHLYSIWRKIQKKGLEFSQVYDVRAVRVLVDTITDCYAALGHVHTVWQHIPKEFDDYITNPKSNMYQSLHTAVIGPDGRTLEVQIRTHKMHEHAEYGVAAHWKYKEAVEGSAALDQKVAWLRQVLEWKDEHDESSSFMERFEAEVLHDRVYVITPRGQVVDLPTGATPLDFAYQIHTDVGHRCRGAKADGVIVPLTYALRSGQKVEVLTTRQGGPSRDWLNPNLGYTKTARARARIRHWFRQQDFEKNVSAGREAYDRDLKRLGVDKPDVPKLLKRFNVVRFDDLLAAIGRGDVTTTQVANTLQELVPRARTLTPVAPSAKTDEGVRIQGVGNLMTQLARCCRPVPPDRVIGYITRGRGVTIHRQDCRNALRLGAEERARMIDVSWSEAPENTYPVDVMVSAYDRQGLLRDVSTVVANEKVNVTAMKTETDRRRQMATMRLTAEVKDVDQLSRLLDRLSQLPNVFDVHRA